MGLKNLLAKEIYIRFNEAESGFICTIRAAGLRIRSQEYLLEVGSESVAGSTEKFSAPSATAPSATEDLAGNA